MCIYLYNDDLVSMWRSHPTHWEEDYNQEDCDKRSFWTFCGDNPPPLFIFPWLHAYFHLLKVMWFSHTASCSLHEVRYDGHMMTPASNTKCFVLGALTPHSIARGQEKWFCGANKIQRHDSWTTRSNQSARDIMEFCSVNMDAWYYRISVACDTVE